MRAAFKTLAGLAVCAALALVVSGCTSEQISFTLVVTADPNPVVGVADVAGRRWDYRVAITNPNPVGVFVDFYHTEITKTDSGYTQPLLVSKDSPQIIDQWIAPGGTFSYAADRKSNGNFSRGTERRIYHTRGDDGRFYSGEVVIELQ